LRRYFGLVRPTSHKDPLLKTLWITLNRMVMRKHRDVFVESWPPRSHCGSVSLSAKQCQSSRVSRSGALD